MSLTTQLTAALAFSISQMEAESLNKPAPSLLTERESQILALVSEGETNSSIAAKMYLSTGTVRNYVSSILMKLNVPNRAAAASYYTQRRG